MRATRPMRLRTRSCSPAIWVGDGSIFTRPLPHGAACWVSSSQQQSEGERLMIPNDAGKTVPQLTLRVKELEARSARTRASIICAFNQMLDLKDLNTGCHSTRLAEWGVRVARDLGADESCLHDIETAALLHDIGKVGIPDAILHKAGTLNDDEWMLMK